MFGRSKRTEMAGRMERRAERLESTGTGLSQTVAEKGAMASRRASDILRRAADDITNAPPGSYRAKMADSMAMARDEFDKDTEVVKANIREHPIASVAMAVGVGFMAGAALSILGSYLYQEAKYETRYS